MTTSWLDRVRAYMDALERCNESLNEALDNTRLGTTSLDTPGMSEATAQLSAGLKELEALIADRKLLLDADDAPLRGVSLRDVLNRCIEPDARALADRCHRLSRAVDLTRERAVALFVCQFQLGDLSSHLLAILRSGADHGVTYEQGKSDVKRTQLSGSVFNRAA
ncbi:MAG: hypothetical protein ACO1RT_16695 [Planctomycetaceae bacterium]